MDAYKKGDGMEVRISIKRASVSRFNAPFYYQQSEHRLPNKQYPTIFLHSAIFSSRSAWLLP
jgi:hypothetical protein